MLTKVKSHSFENRISVPKHEVGFHAAMRRALLVARVLGMLPLSGLNSPHSEKLKFSLRSPYSLLYLGTLAGQSFILIVSLLWVIENQLSISTVTNFMSYLLGWLSVLNLASIGRAWPDLIIKVKTIEKTLPPFQRNIPFICNVALAVLLVTGTLEHLLREVFIFGIAKYCDPNNILKTFFLHNRAWIFNYTSFNWWIAIFMEIMLKQASLLWNYSHILIMLISIYLAEHFATHNKLLKKASKEENFSCDEFRTQYTQMASLVQLINKQFGLYMILSLGSNLYWTCVKVFFCLNNVPESGTTLTCPSKKQVEIADVSTEHAIFSAFSFLFLIARSSLVLILAARVHSLSIYPLRILYKIPANKFTVEIERYIDQIVNTNVALTGLGFFSVTRTMILTFFATIVTYELVMLQF